MTDESQKYILLDTCIIEYLADPEKVSIVVNEITSAAGAEFIFGISEFTIFECLNTANVETENQRLEILNNFTTFPVNSEVLITAARLGSLYKQEKIGKEKIAEGDKIIAATAIANGAYICTANPLDFPYPFFKSDHIRQISYMRDGKEEAVLIHYLGHNLEKIISCYEKRNTKVNSTD